MIEDPPWLRAFSHVFAGGKVISGETTVIERAKSLRGASTVSVSTEV
jgi:hypothetical protein